MRRFILVNQKRPDQAIGEGVVWGDSTVSLRWFEPKPFENSDSLELWDTLEDLLKEQPLPTDILKALWIDPYWDAPYPVTRSVNGGPYLDATQFPSHRLHDGWGKPNGVVDSNGTPLHVGQQVKLLTGGYEDCGDIGEITSLTINEHGRLRISLAGVNCCNMADVDLAEIEAIETTTEQTLNRCGGQKPSWGFVKTITIPTTDPEEQECPNPDGTGVVDPPPKLIIVTKTQNEV
jgi:hypothetical protein